MVTLEPQQSFRKTTETQRKLEAVKGSAFVDRKCEPVTRKQRQQRERGRDFGQAEQAEKSPPKAGVEGPGQPGESLRISMEAGLSFGPLGSSGFWPPSSTHQDIKNEHKSFGCLLFIFCVQAFPGLADA